VGNGDPRHWQGQHVLVGRWLRHQLCYG
jgi:hypothetical protein